MIDKPQHKNEAGVAEFVKQHKDLQDSNRFRRLPVESLEEYYPDHKDWRRTADAVAKMTGHQKVSLARRVGSEITKEQVTADMPVIVDALERCWAGAF